MGNKEHDAIVRRGLEVQGVSISVHELIHRLRKLENNTSYNLPVVARLVSGRTVAIYLINNLETGSLLSSPFLSLDLKLHIIQSTARGN